MESADDTEKHELFGGAVTLFRRSRSRFWQCYACVDGESARKSSKETNLALAKDFAELWYLDLRTKTRNGEALGGRKFRQAAIQFEREYEGLLSGHRHPRHIYRVKQIIRLHLLPYFGAKPLAGINAGHAQEYRIHRSKSVYRGRPPAMTSLNKEIIVLRQILKTAHRHRWIDSIPDLSPPFRESYKVGHRAWFSHDEYRQLYEATRRRAKHPPRERYRWYYEQLHDYVLLLANSGLRTGEAANLEFRDVKIVLDEATNERILEMEVRGKRGIGYCKSTSNAVRPFERLCARLRVDPSIGEKRLPRLTDRVFPYHHRDIFREVVRELGLEKDRDGNVRTPYSLRHSYICFRLMEGAPVFDIAKNCRTSVDMIDGFYGKHLANRLNAAAINVRRPRRVLGDAEPH